MVRRFLDGMKDNKAGFEIVFPKMSDDKDEAVYHAVNFIQTIRRGSAETHCEKKFKWYARRTSLEYDSQCGGKGVGGTTYETDEEENRALKILAETDKPLARKTKITGQQTEQA